MSVFVALLPGMEGTNTNGRTKIVVTRTEHVFMGYSTPPHSNYGCCQEIDAHFTEYKTLIKETAHHLSKDYPSLFVPLWGNFCRGANDEYKNKL